MSHDTIYSFEDVLKFINISLLSMYLYTWLCNNDAVDGWILAGL